MHDLMTFAGHKNSTDFNCSLVLHAKQLVRQLDELEFWNL